MRDLSDAAELLAMDRVRKLIDRWRDQLNDMPAGLLRIQMAVSYTHLTLPTILRV